MLTWAVLETHVANGTLRRWSLYGDEKTVSDGRMLYMLPDVLNAIDQRPWPGSEGERPSHTADRRSAMRMVLKRFVKGDMLNLRRDIKELGSHIDKSIDPKMKGYWEFRSQGRMEETRLFGFFARPGAFVATDFKGRGDFAKGNQAQWNAQRVSCRSKWDALFPTEPPIRKPWPVHTRSHLNAYLERSNDD